MLLDFMGITDPNYGAQAVILACVAMSEWLGLVVIEACAIWVARDDVFEKQDC